MVTEHRSARTSRSPFGIGDKITTLDGKHLGTVKDYTHGYMKIDVHLGRDHWLSRELILHHVPGCVTLSIAREALNQWKGPPA